MGSNFLSGLSSQLESQYGVGESSSNALGIVQDGHTFVQPLLGNYAQFVKQPAERRYVESGFLRLDPFNVTPTPFEVLLQEPDLTVLVKKRAFSSLAENYRPDFMNQEERLYLKITKVLFQNKCRQIATFEKLSKIARIGQAAGQIDDQLMPLLISLVDSAQDDFSDYGNTETGGDFSSYNATANNQASQAFQQLTNVIDRIRKVYAFSPINDHTTWVADNTNIFKTTFAQGTGVIEITNAVSVNTTTSVNFSSGQFSVVISDPYKLMLVTSYDIEKAISDATNFVANKMLFQLGVDSLDKIAANKIQLLNDARSARGASAIEIITDPNNLSGQTVTAIIDFNGTMINFNYNATPGLSSLMANGGVTVSPTSFRGGPDAGDQGLDNNASATSPLTEVDLFCDAVSAIYSALDLRITAQTPFPVRQGDFQDPSGKTTIDLNYVRRKLMFHYGNKQIIQPMDQIHVYMSSKSQVDNRIMMGMQNMFNGLGYFQKLDTTVFDLTNQINTLLNPASSVDFRLEKSIFVGDQFPNQLWMIMRNTFVNDKSGTHVFAGIVDDAHEDYDASSGKYMVNISGKDNTEFFDFGTINLNPGVDTFAGPLYNPVTPFKTSFDNVTSYSTGQVPEFLDENKAILGSQSYNYGLIRHKSGRNFGKPATLQNMFVDKQISQDGTVRNILHLPDGLVYTWKQGIGTLTYNVSSFNATDPETIGQPPITTDPFAGQDIMNVISLLITGVPYNYATYYKAVTDSGNGSARDPQSGQDPAASFYDSITTSLTKNNLLWGGFIPFKSLTLDEETYKAMNDKQISILQQNNVVTTTLNQIQTQQQNLYIASAAQKAGALSSEAAATISNIQNTLVDLQLQLLNQLNPKKQALQTSLPITVAGSDVSYDPNQVSGNPSLSDPIVRAELRRELNFLTRRLSWQVRANEDRNLFIVDDSYDKDYDIINSGFQFKGGQNAIQLFSNQYTTVHEKIKTIADLLSLEVFCDTQGHIRVRPQQYNRMPSSVFYRMMQMKQIQGIQFYPKFLETLFFNQITALSDRLGTIELEIRLDGAVIGIADDASLAKAINSAGLDTGPFQFFSDTHGNVNDIPAVLDNSSPDQILAEIPTSFESALQAQGSLTAVFTAADRAKLVTNTFSSTGAVVATTLTNDYVNQLQTDIFHKSGQQVTTNNFILPQQTGVVIAAPASLVDVVSVTNDIAAKVADRQRVIKQLAGALKNAREAISLDSNPINAANSLLMPTLYGNQNVPEVFANMIEDETFDDYGPGSGTRYIIRDYQILRMQIAEVPPQYTMMEVQGQLDPLLPNGSLPPDFNSAFPQGGNALITAAAVDYDLWQMYGFRQMSAINAPYLSDPNNQCAPYAASLLSRARREILQGSVTISGNEFMQPGEVVYLESRGLLFYVETVSHSINFGSGFTTTLTLKYGHNPGEYIPTPLDVIGKVLYNNRDTGSSIVFQQSSSTNEVALGAIISNPSIGLDSSTNPTDAITSGNYGEFNLKVINNILYTGAGIIYRNQSTGSNLNPTIELRVFYDKNTGSVDSQLANAQSALKTILTGKAVTNVQAVSGPPPDNQIQFDPSIVIADASVSINISSTDESRSPSQKAVAAARNLAQEQSVTGPPGSPDPVTTAMMSYVIDCVLKLNPPASTN
jgi:hypothetical protein